MTGITREQAAQTVAALFGTTARQTHESHTYDPWEVTDGVGKSGGSCMTAASRPRAGNAGGRPPHTTGGTVWK